MKRGKGHALRKHNTSPDGFESVFINAGGSETKEEFRAEEMRGESLGGALLGSLEML